VGDVWADLPLVSGPRDALFLAVDTRVTIEKTTSDFAFQLGHLEYELELGWRSRRGWTGRRPFYLYAAQRGQDGVDRAGKAWVRYLGAGLESRGFRRRIAGPNCPLDDCPWSRRLEWRVMGGPVVEEQEVSADGVLRGEARYWFTRAKKSFPAVGFDLEVDGLLDGSRFNADVEGGPRISLPVAGGRSASFFLHYLHSRNPLGLEEDAFMLGFAYEEGLGDGLPTPPEVDGKVGFGGGEGRLSGEFLLRVLSPTFAGRTRVTFLLDSNILTGDDTDELYYLYHLGVERPVAGRTVAGIYLHHRSNHQLATPGTRITSINVLEAGVETDDWYRVGRGERGGRRAIAGSARVGFLLESSFGEDTFWHARGGLRWTILPRRKGPSPFVLVELEAGDVGREKFAIGLALARQLDVQLEYRNDDQYFGRDRTAYLVSAYYGF